MTTARCLRPHRCAPQHTGSNDLDAAVLVLPLLDLEPRDSPRVRATIEAVRRQLSAGGPLLHRYPPGGDRPHHGYLGNYPQTLTHAALVQAALAIRDTRPN
jgi:GH15 family glucan-1,4-alpha-glucosidase